MKIQIQKIESKHWYRDNTTKDSIEIVVNEEYPDSIRVIYNQEMWHSWEDTIAKYEEMVEAIKELQKQYK